MKSVTKMMLGAVAATAFGTLAAQEQITYNTIADWTRIINMSEADGIINVKSNAALFSKKFTIDPSKRYTLKATVRAQKLKKPEDRSLVYVGFNVFDAKGRVISSAVSNCVPGTLTEVVENAAKGDTAIKIKDGAKFKTGYMTIVADAKEDLSDLPNFNIVGSLKTVVRNGDVWEITLKKPLVKDIKAGTVIREHAQGGYLYTAGWKKIGAEWTAMSGSITGVKKGVWQSNVWPAGAVTAQVVILVNLYKKDLETQFKDITLNISAQ